jgi:hypothetical protein
MLKNCPLENKDTPMSFKKNFLKISTAGRQTVHLTPKNAT